MVDLIGVSTFRTNEIQSVRTPSLRRGQGVYSQAYPDLVSAPQYGRLSQFSTARTDAASSRVHSRSSFASSPCPVSLHWLGTSLGFCSWLPTPPLPATQAGVETGSDTNLEGCPFTRMVRPRVARLGVLFAPEGLLVSQNPMQKFGFLAHPHPKWMVLTFLNRIGL